MTSSPIPTSFVVDPIVRLRGLPYSSNEKDISSFLSDVSIKPDKNSIVFVYGRDGRLNGEAFVVCNSREDAEKALSHHKDYIGRRYIEVFPATFDEMTSVTGRILNIPSDDYVLRLRGLPFNVEKSDIQHFFEGLQIATNGIGLLLDNFGRSTGEAFVQFVSEDMFMRAKEKHLEKIGHRYIEIFKSNMLEANNAIRRQMDINDGQAEMAGYGGRDSSPPRSSRAYARPAPYPRPGGGGGMPALGGYRMHERQRSPSPSAMYRSAPMWDRRGGGAERGHYSSVRPLIDADNTPGYEWQSSTGHWVHMRGLPFSVTTREIMRFFEPLTPAHVEIGMNPTTGRLSGDADADFYTHEEAEKAMRKDRQSIGSRYIELFLHSRPHAGRGGMPGGPVAGGPAQRFRRSDGDRDGFVDPVMGGGMMGGGASAYDGSAAAAAAMQRQGMVGGHMDPVGGGMMHPGMRGLDPQMDAYSAAALSYAKNGHPGGHAAGNGYGYEQKSYYQMNPQFGMPREEYAFDPKTY